MQDAVHAEYALLQSVVAPQAALALAHAWTQEV